MKNNILSMLMLAFLIIFTFSCKKDDILEPSPDPLAVAPAELRFVVDGANVQLEWQASTEKFDNYELELSKLADFSVIEYRYSIESTANSYIVRGLDLGEGYHARLRTNRISPASFSEWSVLDFTTKPNSILLPIAEEDVVGNTVTVKWEFPEDESVPPKVTKVKFFPHAGPAIEVPLSAQDIENNSLTFSNLEKDVQYTVRIYNNSFLRGTQMFTTVAEPVNGVWTLSPHSNLKRAIEASQSGDNIVLKPGVYNSWLHSILVNGKSITIKAADENGPKPKVYVKSFNIVGSGTSMAFVGLDLSGSRINEYKQEIPNTADTRWNSWLINVDASATDFNAISFENCIIRNYYTGLLKMVSGQVGNKLTINNSLIHHTGQDQESPFIQAEFAVLKEGVFTNSTYYRSNKMFIVIDNEDSKTKRPISNHIDFTFKNNTVDNSWNHAAFDFNGGLLPTKVLLENNIFSNINAAQNFFGNFAHTANNFDKRLINCNFFNVRSKSTIYGSNLSGMPVHSWELRHPNTVWNEVKPAFIMNGPEHENPNSIKEYALSMDPGYTNPEGLDFSVSASSPLRTVDGGSPIGDPRWW